MSMLLRRKMMKQGGEPPVVTWDYEWDYTSGTYPPGMTYTSSSENGVYDTYVRLYVPILDTGLLGDGEMIIVARIEHAVANWPRFSGKDGNGIGVSAWPRNLGLNIVAQTTQNFKPDGTAGSASFEDGLFHTYRITLQNGVAKVWLDGSLLVSEAADASAVSNEPSWGIRSGGTAWGSRPRVDFQSIKIRVST